MVKTTYIANTIGIPTHGVNLRHHGLRIGERNPKSPIDPPQGEERRRKKEREKEERERGSGDSWWPSHTKRTGVTESCHVRRHDSWWRDSVHVVGW
jgi:hypothetical protein